MLATLLKVIAWWFAISLILGVTWGMVVTVWQQVQERRLAAAIIKNLEESDDCCTN